MKKAFIISVGGIVILATIIYSLPYAIHLEKVQTALKNSLSARLDIRADIDGIAWKWFPDPHISLYRARLSHDRLDVSFNYGELCPDIVGFILRRSAMKLLLHQPDITVKTLRPFGVSEENTGTNKQKPFPAVSLSIKNGHLLLPSDGFLEKLANQTPHSKISGIDAEVALFHNGFDIKSFGRFSFAEKISSRVRLKRDPRKEDGRLKDYWRLDISGENIDLTSAREKVLLLFGDSRIAQKVCDIVRGGGAKTGRYLFEGYTEDFKNLGAMKITALADNADIHVPKVELPLDHCYGPIVIEKSILSGHSLSARMGNSAGENGSIRLDLLDRDSLFRLAVDVDADVEELRGWLTDSLLAGHKSVVKEMGNISSARGRARGRLEIGGSLRRLSVKADVFESDSLVEYRRFDNPCQFKHGRLMIYPDKLTWDRVGGRIGSQYIDDSKGSVSWKDSLRIDIDKIDARLDTAPLLKEITAYPAIKDILAPVIHSATGPLAIKNMTIHGPIKDFKKIKYDFTAAAGNLIIRTPLLPDEARISTSGARISSSRIVLPPSRVDMSGQQLTLETDLSHALWKGFSGSLKITGSIGRRIAYWIKQKAWIPPSLFPGLPCFLNPLTVVINDREISLKGAMVSGWNKEDSITAELDLALSENRLDLKKLTVSSKEETAEMRLYLDRSKPRSLKADFAGSLKKETLDVLLESNLFLTGAITGNCGLEYYFNNTAANRLTGSLEASGVVFHVRGNRIVIDDAALSGHGSWAIIRRAGLKFNDESMIVDGRLYFPDDADIETDLNVESEYVSSGNLQRLYDDLKKTFKNPAASTKSLSPEDYPSPAPKLSAIGTIKIDIKNFQYNPTPDPDKRASAELIKQLSGGNLSGTITLQKNNRITASVLSVNICDLTVVGLVGLPPETTILTFQTKIGAKPDIQQLLDCLGITDRKISGTYYLDATIKGTPDKWTDGYIRFRARDGRLKELAILSKILTLLNVTELFSIDVFKNFFNLGCPYSKMDISGEIADNILTISETKIIGEGLNIFFKGTVNLKTTDLDLVAYVTPLKTIDSIVTLIPYIGKTMAKGEKSIAFIPYKIKGTIKNPDVFLIYESPARETAPDNP